MPIKIDCPNCKGLGEIFRIIGQTPETMDYISEIHEECNGTGKITVYTQEEVDQKIGYVEGLHTPEELNKAIQDTKEACAKICDKERMILIDNNIEFIDLYNLVVFAEEIRNRK